MFEFLERLLVHKGVFLPLDVTQSLQEDPTATYFVPSLLAQGEPSDVWTYKSSDSWMTTLCHSWLLRDGSPENLMEHVTVSLIQDLYEFSQSVALPKPRRLTHTNSFPLGHNSMSEFLQTHESVGRIKIHNIMCWKSSVLVKIGCVFSEPESGEIRESFAEIFVSLVDPQSVHCVSSNSIGSGMTRLVISGKGQAGHNGRKLWKGGYAVALDSIKASLADLKNVDRQVVCPDCLAHSHPTMASTWGWDDVRALAQSGDSGVRCMRGHLVDTDLLCGTCKSSTQASMKMPASDPSRVSKPVSALLDSVVVVGLWDERTQKLRNVGSGFIVDKKYGLIVTAAHILFDMAEGNKFGMPYHGHKRAKAVIGVIPDGSHTAKFRYFAEIVSHDVNNIDACVLRITSKMEQDVEGENCSSIGEIPLLNSTEAIKAEKLQPLKMTRNFELEESVRIVGYNQGGENILEQGKHVNRVVDFAKGYICKNFRAPTLFSDDSSSESSSSMSWNPRQEIVVMMPTISGHSGGPCVNDDGKVVGILSRADPVDRQRCYLVPSIELKNLVSQAKETCRVGSSIGRLANVSKRGKTT
jgi:S1-C subfamily serine protease